MALSSIKFFDNFEGVWTDAIGSGGDVIVYDDNSGWISFASKGLNFDANQIANGSVNNTEFQYLDGATSNIQTQLNAKVGTPAWSDYSSSSTIVGFSSVTTSVINYFVMGKIMFVQFNIIGTSNAQQFSFTIPNASLSTGGVQSGIHHCVNNTTTQNYCTSYITAGSSVVTLYLTNNVTNANSWTATGTKRAEGFLTININ